MQVYRLKRKRECAREKNTQSFFSTNDFKTEHSVTHTENKNAFRWTQILRYVYEPIWIWQLGKNCAFLKEKKCISHCWQMCSYAH